jgi:hypothetical protein
MYVLSLLGGLWSNPSWHLLDSWAFVILGLSDFPAGVGEMIKIDNLSRKIIW